MTFHVMAKLNKNVQELLVQFGRWDNFGVTNSSSGTVLKYLTATEKKCNVFFWEGVF